MPKKATGSDLNLADAITRPKDSVGSIQSKIVRYYDANGVEHTTLANEKICAMYTANGSNISMKIKVKRGGKLYNPLNKNSTYGLDKRDKTTNEPMFKLREVNNKCFNSYVGFLRNKADSLLTIAEREL